MMIATLRRKFVSLLFTFIILHSLFFILNSAAFAASLTDNSNGTVTDSSTGLVWQQGEGGSKTWASALTYCEGLSLAGADDWRLPNVKELESLTDDMRYNPAIDGTYFPDAVASDYWSSTTYAYGPGGAWYVDFFSGYVVSSHKHSSGYVRCVRGGQSGSFGSLAISPTPSTLAFGQTTVTIPSATQTITITNTGTAAAILGTVTLGGSNSSDFTITSDACAAQTLAAGANCSIGVRFNPALAGAKTAALTVKDPAQATLASVALSGTGVVNQPTLVVQKSGAGSGTVDSLPGGIQCGATCSSAFADNSVAALDATPDAGSTFLGWSGGGCSGTGSCIVSLAYGTAPSTTVTASFGTVAPPVATCTQAIGDLVISATACQQFINYSEFSGAIGIAHSSNPANPVLKIDNGTLNLDVIGKTISAPLLTGTSMYVANVKSLGDVALGFGAAFSVEADTLIPIDDPTNKFKTGFPIPSGSLLIARLANFNTKIDALKVGADEVALEGKLLLPGGVTKIMKSVSGVPMDIGFPSLVLSQSKGFYPGGIMVNIKEIAIEGTPVTLSDIAVAYKSEDSSFQIEGTVSIDRLVTPVKGMAGKEFSGRLTLIGGSVQGFAIGADNLNIPIGLSPFYFQKLGGSIDGFVIDPVEIVGYAGVTGGPKLGIDLGFLGDSGTISASCFDVKTKIDPVSYLVMNGSAGLVCLSNFETYKNGFFSASIEGGYHWKTSSVAGRFSIKEPFGILSLNGNMEATTTTLKGDFRGKICTPDNTPYIGGGVCFSDVSAKMNVKGWGFTADLLWKKLRYAVFIDYGLANHRLSDPDLLKHIKVGDNATKLMSYKGASKSASKSSAKSVALVAPQQFNVAQGLELVIIRATWESGTTDMTLTAPDGAVITASVAAASPDSFKYFQQANEAWYAIDKPAAGNWQATLSNADNIGAHEVALQTLVDPPTIAVTTPAVRTSSSTTVDIAYSAAVSGGTPKVSFFYGKEQGTGAGIPIVIDQPLPVGGNGSYSWDVTSVASGVYYLFAEIEDGLNPPVKAYAPGAVEVIAQAGPAATTGLKATVNGATVDLVWDAVSGATNYTIYYTDNPGLENYPSQAALKADTASFSATNLKPSTSYRFSITTGVSGSESALAVPVTVTTAAVPVPAMTLGATEINFGRIDPASSASSTLNIRNTGSTDLIVSRLDLTGNNSALVATSGVTLPMTIAAGGNTDIALNLNGTSLGSVNAIMTITTNDPAAATKIVALTAQVASSTLTVNLVSGGNGTISGATSQTVNNGGTTSAVTAVPVTGFHFVNWSDAHGQIVGTRAQLTVGPVSSDEVITANFAIDTFAVSFVTNGGSTLTSQSVAYNATATAPTAPTKTGSTFAGWYSDAGLTAAFAFTTPITTDTTLYAKWTINNSRDGIITGSGKTAPDLGDALAALMHYTGVATFNATQLAHADVAPLNANGIPVGNGSVDLADVIIILRRTIGIGSW